MLPSDRSRQTKDRYSTSAGRAIATNRGEAVIAAVPTWFPVEQCKAEQLHPGRQGTLRAGTPGNRRATRESRVLRVAHASTTHRLSGASEARHAEPDSRETGRQRASSIVRLVAPRRRLAVVAVPLPSLPLLHHIQSDARARYPNPMRASRIVSWETRPARHAASQSNAEQS